MEQGYHVCDQCGKKYQGEKLAFSLVDNTKQFCSLNCFFRCLHETFDVLIVRDFSLIHKPKEESKREIAKELGEEIAFQVARTRR